MNGTRFKRADLLKRDFQGFLSIAELQQNNLTQVRRSVGGVYIVLREVDKIPDFLDANPCYWFKRQNPTISKDDLAKEWVESAHTIYIGKGDYLPSTDLHWRMKLFLDYGSGRKVAHWGGRATWQIENSADFVVAWKLIEGDPIAPEVLALVPQSMRPAYQMEQALLGEFKACYGGKRPIANRI